MSQPYLLGNRMPAKFAEATADYPPAAKKNRGSRPPCKLARPDSTGTANSYEIGCILRQRLLLAAIITGAGFTVFFVRHLLSPDNFLGNSGWYQVVQGVAAASLVLIATILGSHLPLTIRQLRA